MLLFMSEVHESPRWNGAGDDAAMELRLRIYALPLALIIARLIVSTGIGRSVTRVFLGMWVHEIGHAISAWMCGYLAFPGPWLTPMSAERSLPFTIAVGLALLYGAIHFWQLDRRRTAAFMVALFLAHIFCAVAISCAAARQFVIFAGDGACLVLGTALMLTLYAGPESPLHRGWLRWGFLVIGAGAFMDVFEQWWAARTDVDRIPFGLNEGVGLSDPSVLSDLYGWSAQAIVHRYVVLGVLCLLFLGAVYLVQLSRARTAMHAAEAQ